MIVLPLLLAAAPPGTCPLFKLTAADRAATAALVSRNPEGPVRPGDIGKVMASGNWRAVWGTPKDSERSIYYLRRDAKGKWHNVYAWGGVIPPDERQGEIDWARQHAPGVPLALATCVVDAVIAQ